MYQAHISCLSQGYNFVFFKRRLKILRYDLYKNLHIFPLFSIIALHIFLISLPSLFRRKNIGTLSIKTVSLSLPLYIVSVVFFLIAIFKLNRSSMKFGEKIFHNCVRRIHIFSLICVH